MSNTLPKSAIQKSLTDDPSVSRPKWLPAAPAMFLLLWSLGFPIAKIGIAYADPITFLALRYALVLIVLFPLAILLRPPLPLRGIDWLHLAVVGFLIQGVYFGLCYIAFALGTSAGVVALVVSLQPVLVAVFAPVVLGESIRLKGWAGLMLGLAGAVIVILAYDKVATVSLLGIICSAGALLGMVGAVIYEKRFGIAQHPVTANLVQYVVGLATTLPLALAFENFHIEWTGKFLASMGYLVIGNSLIAITLLLAMIRHGDASKVSALFYLVPPGAALLSWILIGERMPLPAWFGMAVAAAGVFLVTRDDLAAKGR
jgi:drug/metabolite transporter (DMT)-like permease